MTFKSHSEGGSWDGGGHDVPNCNLTERTAVTNAFLFKDSFGVPQLQGIAGLGALAASMAGKTTASVELDCRGGSCSGGGAFATTNSVGGNSVDMCDPSLPPTGIQADTDVTVFHELVHTCGGHEVDAWSMENQFFVGHGTFTPGTTTVMGFIGETTDLGGGLRAGTFVVWERATGHVFVKMLSGGSWNSGPTISRGAQLTNVSFPPV
ncbi:MAG: hypothetical protein ABIT38_23195 [Gemmatimonadaceae bacterium]